VLGEWALSMVGVEEGREFRFRGDLYSQESTFPLVFTVVNYATSTATHGCCLGVGPAITWIEVLKYIRI